jgi:hypothetical protein
MSRPGYSAGQGLRPQSIVIPILAGAALTAFANAKTYANVLAVQSGKVIGVHFNIGGKGGTFSTGTVAVKNGSNTICTLNAASAVAGTPSEVEGSSLSNTDFSKDSVFTLVSAESGGTSPTWQDVTIQIDYIPTGD